MFNKPVMCTLRSPYSPVHWSDRLVLSSCHCWASPLPFPWPGHNKQEHKTNCQNPITTHHLGNPTITMATTGSVDCHKVHRPLPWKYSIVINQQVLVYKSCFLSFCLLLISAIPFPSGRHHIHCSTMHWLRTMHSNNPLWRKRHGWVAQTT